jgi:hypothetical protein
LHDSKAWFGAHGGKHVGVLCNLLGTFLGRGYWHASIFAEIWEVVNLTTVAGMLLALLESLGCFVPLRMFAAARAKVMVSQLLQSFFFQFIYYAADAKRLRKPVASGRPLAMNMGLVNMGVVNMRLMNKGLMNKHLSESRMGSRLSCKRAVRVASILCAVLIMPALLAAQSAETGVQCQAARPRALDE